MGLKELVFGSALVLGGCATTNPANESGNAIKPSAEMLPRNQIKDDKDTISYFDDMDIATPLPNIYMEMKKGDCAITIADKQDYVQMVYARKGRWFMLKDDGCDGTVDYIFLIKYNKKPIYQPRSSNPALFEKDFDSIFSELKQRIKGGNDESK